MPLHSEPAPIQIRRAVQLQAQIQRELYAADEFSSMADGSTTHEDEVSDVVPYIAARKPAKAEYPSFFDKTPHALAEPAAGTSRRGTMVRPRPSQAPHISAYTASSKRRMDGDRKRTLRITRVVRPGLWKGSRRVQTKMRRRSTRCVERGIQTEPVSLSPLRLLSPPVEAPSPMDEAGSDPPTDDSDGSGALGAPVHSDASIDFALDGLSPVDSVHTNDFEDLLGSPDPDT